MPTTAPERKPAPIILPPLVQRNSPNQSTRHGETVDLIVWHESAGSYAGDVSWLCNPDANASAHLVLREDGGEATQLVPIARKAWHASAFNPQAIGVEHSNRTAKGYASERQLEVSARVFGFLCLRYNVPPRWARNGQGRGVVRHLELGRLGGGHTECGMGDHDWQRFLDMVHLEIARGGYRKTWTK